MISCDFKNVLCENKNRLPGEAFVRKRRKQEARLRPGFVFGIVRGLIRPWSLILGWQSGKSQKPTAVRTPREVAVLAGGPASTEFLPHQTKTGRPAPKRVSDETVWRHLTRMSELFARDKPLIARNGRNVRNVRNGRHAASCAREPLQILQRLRE